MAVTVALQEVPGLPGVVCSPDQVSFGEASTLPYQINRGGSIKDRNVKRNNVTFTVPGLTGAQVASRRAEAEANRLAELDNQTGTVYNLVISGVEINNAYLVSAVPSGSMQIGNFQTVPTTTLIFETDEYSVV